MSPGRLTLLVASSPVLMVAKSHLKAGSTNSAEHRGGNLTFNREMEHQATQDFQVV